MHGYILHILTNIKVFLISTFFDRVAGKIVSLPSIYRKNMALLPHFLVRLTLTLYNFG